MKVVRRDFLALSGGLLAGAACGSTSQVTTQGLAPGSRAAFSPTDWDAVRSQFDVDYSWLQFAGFLLVSHPRPVRDAINSYRTALDKNPALVLYDEQHKIEKGVRASAARFVGGKPEELALTDSTTMGLGTLYGGFKLKPGQELVTTEHDHYSTHESLRLRACRDGAKLRRVRLFDDSAKATVDQIVAKLVGAVTEKTRIVAITWVHSATGIKLPVRAIAEALAEKNAARPSEDRALLCVDGVHGFGVETNSVVDLGCDFFVAGCHKWVCGPRGTGLIWGRRHLWHNVVPTVPAFEHPTYEAWKRGNETEVKPGGIPMTPGGFHSFEHRWALPAAFEWQENIGRERIKERIWALNTQLKEGLRAMAHVRLYTPMTPDLSAGIVCFDVLGMKPAAVVDYLRHRRIVASQTPYRVSYARLAPSLLNNEQHVDQVLGAIRELA